MLEVEWFAGKMDVLQQHWSGLEYCLLSEDNKQCYPLLYCKEFILDAVWSTLYGQKVELYGFNFNPRTMPLAYLKETRLLLRNKSDSEFDKNAAMSIKFLNLLERQLGFQKSKLYDVAPSTKHPVFAVVADAKWMHAPPLLSLYALLLRVGMGYESGTAWKYLESVRAGICRPICRSDSRYLLKSLATIKEVVATKCSRFLPTMEENWPENVREWDIHENCGIVSLAEGDNGWSALKRIMPQWYPNKE